MGTNGNASILQQVRNALSGGFGAGFVLIFLPGVALVLGAMQFGETPGIVLPILAIFGILMLFGALSLVSTLFARLSLSDRAQALALPQGSVRAAIALSLVVLFAIISIMLYQSISKPYVIENLSKVQLDLMTADPRNHVIAVIPDCDKSNSGSSGDCPDGDRTFSLHILQPPGQESTDLAKQLLILVGTLMTAVTSYYFASRASEPRRESPPETNGATNEPSFVKPATLIDDDHQDGCDVAIVDATPDTALPIATGGVA